jgi:hypothetical protein
MKEIKRKYEKPSSKVFVLKQKPTLLVGSEQTPKNGDEWYWE